MKRTLIATLMAALSLTGMQAQTLKVLGTEVNTTTAQITTAATGCTIDGTVSYDATTKTLTLDNAVLTAHQTGATWKTDATENIIESTIDGLTIKVIGESKLRVGACNSNHALVLGAATTITGPGKLTLTDARYDSEGAAQSTLAPNALRLTTDVALTVQGANIVSYLPWTATGRDRSGWAARGTLIVTDSDLEFPLNSQETNHANIGYFKTVTLDATAYVYPTGLQFTYETEGWDTMVTRYLASTDGETMYRGPISILREAPSDPLPDYTLYVAGQRVKKGGTIEGDGITGTVTFDEETTTLTLDNATIATTGGIFGISSEIDGLFIDLIGDNTITVDDGNVAAMQLAEGTQTTITSTIGGSLQLRHSPLTTHLLPLIDMAGASLTVSNCTVEADNHLYGGYKDDSELIIDNANFSLTGCSYDGHGGTVTGFGYVEVKNATVTTPENGVFMDWEYYALAEGPVEEGDDDVDFYTGRLEITADGITVVDPTKVYLKVAGYDVINGAVTTQNADNQIYGSVTFDAATRTLTLDNANISTITNAIETENDLTILLRGDNKIVVDESFKNTFALALTGSNHVTVKSDDGTGTLTIINFTQSFDGTGDPYDAGFQGVKLEADATLTIKDCTVTSYESWMPNQRYKSPYPENYCGHLVVDNATLSLPQYIDDDYWPTLGYFRSITLQNARFDQPADGVYNPTDGFIHSEIYAADYDGYWWDAVRIVPSGSTPVEEQGYIDIAGLTVKETTAEIVPTGWGTSVTGTISYDAETKTLTLDNATIKCYVDGELEDNNMEDVIYSTIDGLTINLIGQNTVYYGWGRGLMFRKDATITSQDGTGQLLVTTFSTNVTYPEGLYVSEGTTLTISNTMVQFDMPVDLTGEDDDAVGGTLAIDNATVSITPEANVGFWGYLRDVDDLLLTNATLQDPDGRNIHFDSTKHYLASGDFGNRYKGPILITADNTITGIGEAASLVDSEGVNSEVYDLQGRQIENRKSLNRQLQRGLYISQGRKVVVK